MNIVAWAIFGFVVGFVTYTLDPQDVRGGLIGAMFLGTLGAIVGGLFATFLLGINLTTFNVTSLIIAVGGSLVVALTQRAFSKRI